ncbi:MAG TPA: hypothetical protein VFV50_07525 [Bdellovibrionales bacterium]|nr:hypothetical protein [Bdellovibrionales bacterium]
MQRLEIHSHEHKISSLTINWGLERRPLWAVMESLPLNALIKWVDRFAPFEAVASEWAVVEAIETGLKLQVPGRVQSLRAIYLEIQRVLWSFDYFAGIFRAIEDTVRLEEALRLREMVFEIQETLTGNRVLPQILRVGGIERDLSLGESKKLRTTIQQLSDTFRFYFGDVAEDPLILRRLRGVLPITKERAAAISLRGPLGHASGILEDARVRDPIGIYSTYGIHCYDGPALGDALTRFKSVQFQVSQSLKLLALFLAAIQDGEWRIKVPADAKIPSGAWLTVVEAGPGPMYALVRNGEIRLAGHSTRMRGSIRELLLGLDSDDFELGLASLSVDFAQADIT